MKITIEAPFHFNAEDKKFMEGKMKDLTRFESRMTQVNAFFKKDDGKVANGILSRVVARVPGKDLFAESSDHNAIKSFVSSLNALKRQIKDRRDRLNDHQSEVREINEIVNNTY